MKLSLILVLLISSTVFAQPDNADVVFEESPQRESEPPMTYQDYSISNGSLIINYSLVDQGDINVGCSACLTSYSFLLPYTSNKNEVVLSKNNFTFRYSYSGGLMTIDSQKANLINLNINQIDNIVYVNGDVQFFAVNHLNEEESQKLAINLEFKAHTSLTEKYYNFRSDETISNLSPDPEQEFDQHEEPLIFSDVEPEFPGGTEAMMKYISQSVVYPQSCLEAGIQGRVYLSFVIEKDGSISMIKILRGLHKDLDREAIRVIKSMPKWKPGEMNNGKKVRVKYTIPVMFKLV